MSASRIVDRGRLLLGFLLVAPLGVLIGVPVLSEATNPAGPQWVAQFNGPSEVQVTEVPTADAILARFSEVQAAEAANPAPVPAHEEEGEAELEATTDPVGYVPGTPPPADLAATLRQSEARFAATQAVPQTNDPVARAMALAGSPRVIYTRSSQISDISTGTVDPRLVDLLLFITTRRQSITITSMRTDHSLCVAGSNPCRVSAHKRGRAVDIAAVNGQACTGSPTSECGRLYEELVATLRGSIYQPSQIIHGYDPWPSEPWNFAMGNHRDHIHIGY